MGTQLSHSTAELLSAGDTIQLIGVLLTVIAVAIAVLQWAADQRTRRLFAMHEDLKAARLDLERAIAQLRITVERNGRVSSLTCSALEHLSQASDMQASALVHLVPEGVDSQVLDNFRKRSGEHASIRTTRLNQLKLFSDETDERVSACKNLLLADPSRESLELVIFVAGLFPEDLVLQNFAVRARQRLRDGTKVWVNGQT